MNATKTWDQQGCDQCRRGILSGTWPPPTELGHIGGGHFVHRCEFCGAYWVIALREPHTLSDDEAERLLLSIQK